MPTNSVSAAARTVLTVSHSQRREISERPASAAVPRDSDGGGQGRIQFAEAGRGACSLLAGPFSNDSDLTVHFQCPLQDSLIISDFKSLGAIIATLL